MATLFIAVFAGAAEVALGDPIQEITVEITASSVQSDPIDAVGANRRRRRVRCFADAKCFVNWGQNPTALDDGTGGRPMPAEGTEYFDIEAGHRLAVIARA